MEFLLSDFWADHFRHLYRRHRREPVRLCRPPLRRCPRLRHLHGTLVRHSGTNDIKLFYPNRRICELENNFDASGFMSFHRDKFESEKLVEVVIRGAL